MGVQTKNGQAREAGLEQTHRKVPFKFLDLGGGPWYLIRTMITQTLKILPVSDSINCEGCHTGKGSAALKGDSQLARVITAWKSPGPQKERVCC